MNVKPSTTFTPDFGTGETGLVGTLAVGIYQGDTAILPLQTADINEIGTTGVYVATLTSPDTIGAYTILWSLDGTLDADQITPDDLFVTSSAPDSPPTGDTYATVDELARLLKVNSTTFADQLEEVLLASTGEINSEINRVADDMEPWELALASQVNIERAIEHWHARPLGFNVIGLDSAMPMRLARDSWEPYANKLAPLRGDNAWGIA